MKNNIKLPLAILLSSKAKCPIASSQILSLMHHTLDFDPSKKLLLRLLPLLSHQQRDFLKSLSP